MRGSLAVWIVATMATVSAVGACDGGPEAPDATSGVDGTGPSFMVIGGVANTTSLATVPDARVCVIGDDAICATTDSSGLYSLDVPAPLLYSRSGLIASADGYYTGARLWFNAPNKAALTYPAGVPLLSLTDMGALAAAGGFAFPAPGTAFVELRVLDAVAMSGLAGATVTLQTAAGTTLSPVYADASGALAPALTASSASGVLVYGGVPPGDFELVVSAPGKTCGSGTDDWPGSGGAQGAGLALADTLTGGTELTISCETM